MKKYCTKKKITRIWEELEKCLYDNKLDLIKNLATGLNNDESLVVDINGAKGTYKDYSGMFYINCSRKGQPFDKTGHGKNDKSHYFWIPVIYKNKEDVRSYVLSLLQEELDTFSANIHQNFTKLQFLKNTNKGYEIGDQFNPTPEKHKDYYLIKYNRGCAYPSLTEKEMYNHKLDMGNYNYSSKEAAKLFWQFIEKDLFNVRTNKHTGLL